MLLVSVGVAVTDGLAELLEKEDPENDGDADALTVTHDDSDVVSVGGIEGDPDTAAETVSEPVCEPVSEARSVDDKVPVPHVVVEPDAVTLKDGTRERVAAAEPDTDTVVLPDPVAANVVDCVIDNVTQTENVDESDRPEVEHAECDGLGVNDDELLREVENEPV